MFDENYLNSICLLEKATGGKSEVYNIKKKINDEIKKGEKITVGGLKKFVREIYQETPEQMVSDLPAISGIIRLTMTVGVPTAINPFLGLFALIVDRTLKNTVDHKYIPHAIRHFKSEISKTEEEISKCKDEKEKKNLDKLLSQLKSNLNKLEEKQGELGEYKDSHLKYEKEDNSLNEEIMLYVESVSLLDENIEFTEVLLEGVLDTARDIKDNVKEKTTQVKRNIKYSDKKTSDNVDSKTNSLYLNLKHSLQGNERDKLVSKSLPSVSKLIKKAVLGGGLLMINPAIAAIGLITSFALKKKISNDERRKLMIELKQELAIVDEKIKDADSSGDRKKKYELMRLRNKIVYDIDKLKRYI